MNSDDLIPDMHAETAGDCKVVNPKPPIPRKKTKRRKTRKTVIEKSACDANPFVTKAADIRRQLQDNKTDGVWFAVLLGYYLVRAKAAVGHGEWSRQMQKHCPLSTRTAQRYMALAESLLENHLKNDNLSDLKIIDLPSEVAAGVKAEIGVRSLQELYLDFEISKKRKTSKLLPEATLLKQFSTMRQRIEGMDGVNLGSEETVESLTEKLKSCSDIIEKVFHLFRTQAKE